MTLVEIKTAVNAGNKVFWVNENYEVRKCLRHNNEEYFFIYCVSNSNVIGLNHADGITLNGKEEEFYIEDLFNKFEELPKHIQNILDENDSDVYTELDKINAELNLHGYEFDYYLDGNPFNLKKI